MTQIIFTDETPKGWIPPSIAAPFICIFLVAISSLPFDFGLQYLGLTDAKGSPRGPLGFCLLLALFILWGLRYLAGCAGSKREASQVWEFAENNGSKSS